MNDVDESRELGPEDTDDGPKKPESPSNKELTWRGVFRYFVIVMLVIGGVQSIYQIATDPGVAYRLRASLAHLSPQQRPVVPAAPSGDVVIQIERLHGALMRARDAVRIYRDAHGYLPDIASADVADSLWTEAERDDFRVATGGGLLALASASREADMIRLVGVYGGALSEDKVFRKAVAAFSQRGDGPQPAFLRFNGGVYEGNDMSVYIPLHEAAEDR